jgi:DNA-binding helix-hairpin-helix protein with protein kinase domain
LSLHRASTGAIVNLGKLLGRGGEGSVHAVGDTPKLVAKIYLKPPDAAKVEKLRLMIRGQSPGLLGVAAWPIDLLTDERGAVRGFLMGRISARQDAHRLYSPKSRRRTFPDADFRFVVRAATNLARAFAQIHVAGHVIGDVNHGNALIGKDGTAVLIDCDSIQVRERARNRFFTCDVGTPLFTPPELQGKVFRGLRRTEASDRFGLAVLIFHLLFQGRHPFAGVYAEGEMPIERAIAESRFAYGAHAESLDMSAPPGTLPLATFGRPIARMFERAFAPPGGEEERPSAIEWIEALQTLENDLAACPRRPRHFHPRDAGCCWCDIEMRTGAKLFDDGQTANADSDAVTAQELWKAIEGVQPPEEIRLPTFAFLLGNKIAGQDSWSVFMKRVHEGLPSLLAGGIAVVAVLSYAIGAAFALLAIALMAIGGIVVSSFDHDAPPSRLPRALRIEWEHAVRQWRSHSGAGLFTGARLQLQQARRSLVVLTEQQREELERLERLLEPGQHETFLDAFEIDKTPFQAVTRSHVELLVSRGIRSAGDIRRKRAKVHKLVPAAVATELRSWANQCALNFKFDKRDPVYLADAAKIEDKYGRQRKQFLEELRRGPELLAAKRDEVASARARAEDALRRKHEYLRKRHEEQNQ